MKRWLGAAVIVGAAVVYEFLAIASDDLWEWSEILSRISDNKFASGITTLFIGFTLGHAMAPHISRIRYWLRRRREKPGARY